MKWAGGGWIKQGVESLGSLKELIMREEDMIYLGLVTVDSFYSSYNNIVISHNKYPQNSYISLLSTFYNFIKQR